MFRLRKGADPPSVWALLPSKMTVPAPAGIDAWLLVKLPVKCVVPLLLKLPAFVKAPLTVSTEALLTKNTPLLESWAFPADQASPARRDSISCLIRVILKSLGGVVRIYDFVVQLPALEIIFFVGDKPD